MSERMLRLMMLMVVASQTMEAFSMLDRLGSNEYSAENENIENPVIDYFDDNRKISGIKRHSNGGTCTCTCETKPVSRKAEVPPLMRTAMQPKSPSKVNGGHGGVVRPQEKTGVMDEMDGEGHKSDITEESKTAEGRFPWKNLPDVMCYRNPCRTDADCCQRYNLCDGSAHICYDCWYGSSCKTEADCCQRFPFCRRIKNPNRNDTGSCVNEL